MFNDKELSRLRALAHSVIALSNSKGDAQTVVTLKRGKDVVHVTVAYRPGVPKPSDAMGYLGDLADNIRSELRLEQTSWGSALYKTSESNFEMGLHPQFSFTISKSGAANEVD